MSDEPIKTERTAISLPAALYAQAKKNARTRGFTHSFSAYIAWLIDRDHAGSVERETLQPTPSPKAEAARPPAAPNPKPPAPGAPTSGGKISLNEELTPRSRTANPGGGPKARSTKPGLRRIVGKSKKP